MHVLLGNNPCCIPFSDGTERYFVKAGSRWPFSVRKKRNDPLSYTPFPFYLAYTAALLRAQDIPFTVIDGVTLNMSETEFVDHVRRVAPDFILLETTTPTFLRDLETLRSIKDYLPRTRVALAGTHVTTFPHETLSNPLVDFIFLQEYEQTASETIRRLSHDQSLEGIGGIGYKKNGVPIVVPPSGLVDVQTLPFPDRDNFPKTGGGDINAYWDGFCQYRPAAQMHGSRGCPFRCNFCLWTQVMYQNGPYRPFPPRRVVDEMELLYTTYRAREIYFDDDTFTGNRTHTKNVCKEIQSRFGRARFSLMGDLMVSDEETIRLLADAGCIGMKFGVESADPTILRMIGKPIDLEKIKRLSSFASSLGIKTHATFTFGLFGETKETMRKTLEFAKSLDVDTIQVSINTPFPGTRYYEEAKKRGLLLTEEWSKFDGSFSSVITFEHLSHDEVESFACRAFSEWLRAKRTQPRWILRQVRNAWRRIEGRGASDFLERVIRLVRL